MRTPHGDADVSIVSSPPATTLGDLVAAVTGQAVPRLVQVDDHVVDATTPLGDAGLLLGSVVTSEPATTPSASDADVDLVQVAGHGAGRISRLAPGRYRIGPGRRSSADELAVAPVEHVMFEFVVEPTAAASEVSVADPEPDRATSPTASPATQPAIDGVPVGPRSRWSHGTLSVGGRAFQFEAPARSEPSRTLSMPDRDGSVAFSRPPRRRSAPERRPVVDAVRDAAAASPALWERRPGQPDAFALPIGLRDDADGAAAVVTADLSAERAVAIAGSEHFRSALARTLVIEATTLHGPADVDLVVLTSPDRLADWDWAKWLPHLRLDGVPAIWSERRDISRWADGAGGRAVLATTPWISSHLTIAIIDDPGLWNRRDSPLRALVSNPPDDLRLIALCDDAAQAPAICTTVVSETATDRARLQSFARSDDGGDLRPALAEASVAARVARALAPLADVDLPPAPPPTSPAEASSGGSDRLDAATLIGVDGPDDVEARWEANTPRPSVPIGRRGGESVELAVSDDVVVVLGSSIGDAFDVAATLLLGQLVDRSPDALWVAPIAQTTSERSAWWWQLPHATDPHDLDTTIDGARLISRLRAVLDDPAGPARVVVVAEATRATPTLDLAWLEALSNGVRATDRLALVVVTDRAEVTVVGDTVIAVDQRSAGSGAPRRRDAVITTGNGAPGPAFVPLQRSASTSATLVLEPFVIGRALTPLERRIEQQRTQGVSGPDPDLGQVVGLLRRAAANRAAEALPRTVVPPPLPTRVDLDELFASSPGDGVPLGLVDDPGAAGSRVLWWEPGRGSMLVFGSRRSGVDQVLATLLVGLVDRFSELDVRLVVVELSSARRRALDGIDRAVRVVAPDQADEVGAALDEIDTELARTADAQVDGDDGPRTVVLINDLVHLRRRYADHPLGARIDDTLMAATVDGAGIDVVASASELDEAGPFATAATHRLVGASSSHDELLALGVQRPAELDGIAGRCRSFPDGALVQLATSDSATETLLARRSTGAAT